MASLVSGVKMSIVSCGVATLNNLNLIDMEIYQRSKRKKRFVNKMLRSNQRKHAIWWLASLQPDYLLRKPLPWICFDALAYIRPYLFKGMRVFEYGSGGSTLFWQRQKAQLTSIEHDQAWYHRLQKHSAFLDTVDYRLVPPERSDQKSAEAVEPSAYTSMLPEYAGYTFAGYCSQIDEFPDEYFDIVLIDGRARPYCIEHAHQKVKRGGLLILDNSDRAYYLDAVSDFLSDYCWNAFSGVTPGVYRFTQTSVFVRAA
jgi:hypothetical protein